MAVGVTPQQQRVNLIPLSVSVAKITEW